MGKEASTSLAVGLSPWRCVWGVEHVGILATLVYTLLGALHDDYRTFLELLHTWVPHGRIIYGDASPPDLSQTRKAHLSRLRKRMPRSTNLNHG